MVKGLESFKAWFRGFEKNYAVIGGTACDLLMSEAGAEFRATRDIDMVLIVEALDTGFGVRFWEYIKKAGYEHRRKSTDAPEFYRFSRPKSTEYPMMIELFSRRIEGITLPPDAVLTPLPVEDDISSLSAILLEDDYYGFLRTGVALVDGIPILDAAHLIPFKAKAWLDLSERKASGGQVDGKDIRKHRNDVFRLSAVLSSDFTLSLPEAVKEDMRIFLSTSDGEKESLSRIAAAYGFSSVPKRSIAEQLAEGQRRADEHNTRRNTGSGRRRDEPDR